eukprot:1804867-Pyramimonas_sp.AAC.1
MTKETHTEEQAIQAVLAKYPRYSCDYDEEGVMGVEIEDEHKGIKRFKRGVKKSQDKIKERMHDDNEQAQQRHEDLKAKHLRIPVRSSVREPEADYGLPSLDGVARESYLKSGMMRVILLGCLCAMGAPSVAPGPWGYGGGQVGDPR